MSAPYTLHGTCHCGAIRVELRLSATPESCALNACQCSFCRAHGARTWSDPQGGVTYRAARVADLKRYRFGLKTADFLLCATCGVYVGAILEDGGAAWSTVNVEGLRVVELHGREARPADYDNEGASGRVARRKSRWTPASIAFEAPPAAAACH